ncbi:nitroreductase family protein [Halomarina pelagica]|uniref:nitroreductase family protein n=1 Tax=Halomarina pelagica TaxID=2961599 RepID=UPI0020C4C10C|nr:nitroreductase family protein [Halomarina sp. BND7]
MSATDLSTDVWDVDENGFPADAPFEDRLRFLLRYSILAPSSHNSQPWSFAVDGDTIHIHADDSRWLEVADAGRRELHISLGCALENLLIAAARFDFGFTVEYGTDKSDAVVSVRFDPAVAPDQSDDVALFEAITTRRTSHQVFLDRVIPSSTLDQLRALVREDDVDLLLIDDETRKEKIAELQVEADERQMADPAYRRELGH